MENTNNNQAPAPAEIPSSRANIQIRTQATDIESLKQTGGAHPLPETVSVAAEVSAPEPAPLPQGTEMNLPAPAPAVQTFKPKTGIPWYFWVAGIIILFLIGYYLVPLFFG